jgi:hypothetical protein
MQLHPRGAKSNLLVSVSWVSSALSSCNLRFSSGKFSVSFQPPVPEKSLEMTRPTSFLNHPTGFFRANFRAIFGRMEWASVSLSLKDLDRQRRKHETELCPTQKFAGFLLGQNKLRDEINKITFALPGRAEMSGDKVGTGL